MSKLEKFLGKSQIKKIGGEDVEIYPLLFKDTPAVIKLTDSNPDTRASAMQDLIKSSLKKSFPEATDEDIMGFDMKYLGEFLNAVFEVSGLDIDKKKLEEMTASLTQTT